MNIDITLSPVRSFAAPLEIEKRGTALIVNGEAYDFGFLSDGDTLPRAAVSGSWLASDVTCRGGVLSLAVALPHGPNAPEETRFPAPVTATKDGPIDLPPYDTPGESDA